LSVILFANYFCTDEMLLVMSAAIYVIQTSFHNMTAYIKQSSLILKNS